MGKATRIKAIEPGEAPTPEQIAQGGYERKFVTHVETGTVTTAHISAHSPVERWIRADRLSDSQIAAIALVRGLWDKCGLKQRVTANYGERLPVAFENEWAAVRNIQARKDLDRIEGYVPPHWWECFENVCRFDEPAGVAGSSLGYGSRNADVRAHMIVVCTADLIAREERLT